MGLTFKEVQNAGHEPCGEASHNNCGNEVADKSFARAASLAWKEVVKIFGFSAHLVKSE
jgi:hypothetical protein